MLLAGLSSSAGFMEEATLTVSASSKALWTSTSRLASRGPGGQPTEAGTRMVSRKRLVPSHTIPSNDSQPWVKVIRGEDIEKYMFTWALHWIRMKHTSLAIKAGLRQQSIICKYQKTMGTDINMRRRCKSKQ